LAYQAGVNQHLAWVSERDVFLKPHLEKGKSYENS
ncbi:MAG: hypothetical protein Q617_SPSC00394G0001, partial [Streptococcus sp. DORA_10]